YMKRLVVLVLAVFLMFNLQDLGAGRLSIGEDFYEKTKLTTLSALKPVFGFKHQPPLYKRYEKAKEIKLPIPDFRGICLEEAIKRRRSIRDYRNEPLSIKELSQLLFASQGITGYYGNQPLRAAPSAGALYPFEIYLIVNQVEGIDRGIYHYSVLDHSLELVKLGDYRSKSTKCCLNQDVVGKSAVTFVLTAIFRRTTYKYGERGYRYVYIEAGHISQNISLQAVSLGLGSVCIGAFYDDKLNNLLEIDGQKEAAIYVHAVGKI
ncbi:MAG: SagB/ThcOx family dehydrogenase, partial [bacterium]|nr:SagB/ThcOx family dehydrogenase [bacterium]